MTIVHLFALHATAKIKEKITRKSLIIQVKKKTSVTLICKFYSPFIFAYTGVFKMELIQALRLETDVRIPKLLLFSNI